MNKTTQEIRALLSEANLDFETVENQALNSYLPRLFLVCPFNQDCCTQKQCVDCEIYKKRKEDEP